MQPARIKDLESALIKTAVIVPNPLQVMAYQNDQKPIRYKKKVKTKTAINRAIKARYSSRLKHPHY